MKTFRYVIIGIGVWYLFFRSPGDDKPEPFPMRAISEATGVQEIPMDQRQRVVLITGTSWCGACKRLEKMVTSKPEWKAFVNSEIQFVSIDVPNGSTKLKPEVQKVIQQYDIRSYPTMIIIDKDNKKIDQVVGAGAPVENYKKWIRSHAAASARKA